VKKYRSDTQLKLAGRNLPVIFGGALAPHQKIREADSRLQGVLQIMITEVYLRIIRMISGKERLHVIE
jgi:hypothetical protein